MRIALLCPDVSRNPLVRTYPIARVLERRHEVSLLGFRSGPEVFAPYRDAFSYDTLPETTFPGFFGHIAELARRVQADAIYAFKPLPASLWCGLLARRRLRVPLFLDVEDWELGGYLDGGWRDWLHHARHLERADGFLWTALSEALARRADGVFVVSRSLQRRFGGTLLVHGADTSFFDPARWERAEARRRLQLGDNRHVVFTGTPTRSKGLDDLLAAAESLGDPRLKVLVVGAAQDQAYETELAARHPSRLLRLGPQPHDTMPLFLAVADAVALPQRATRVAQAQVPGKVFEAMAMGCPIVATRVSDLPEILSGCGATVPPGQPDALAAGLESLLADPGGARELGQTARERCQARYSWDAMERVLDKALEPWKGAA